MTPKLKKTRFSTPLILALGILAFATSSNAAVTFTFVGGVTPFDSAGVGASATLEDTFMSTPVDVTLTTIDIIGSNGSSSIGPSAENNLTNVFGTQDSLSIDSATDEYTNENRGFNPGEAWVFSFNIDVLLVSIQLSSADDDTQMTVSSGAYSYAANGDDADDNHDLSNTLVTAGTTIRLEMTSPPTAGDTQMRITNFVVQANAVPEPSGAVLALLGLGGLCFTRRRRSA